MKKTLLLKTLLLLCAFIVGSSSVWADENVSTVSTKFSATGDVTGKITQTGDFKTASWNLDVTWKDANNPYWGDLVAKGSQIGSGSKPATGVVLTGSNIPGTIISVKVNTSVASGGTTTVGVSVGNAAFSCNNKATATLATAATDYEFTGTGSGDVVLTWSQPSTSKAIYIKSVTITYTTGSTPPSITADDVPIAYNATEGGIAYTINNPVDGGAITSAEVTASEPSNWLTVSNTLTSPIGLTCAANSTVNARTATVTLTYTYDTDKTVTKNVTVTQAADPNAFNTITDITAPNTAYKVKGTVVATNAKGFVIGDGTGYVYTYLNAAPTQSVGDKLSIDGTTGSYNHVLQFTSAATIATVEESNYDGTPAVTVLDAAGIAAYNSGYQLSDYVQFEGELVKNDSYYEITVGTGSSTATTRISYPTTAQATALDALLNKTVRVKGYFAGFSSSIFTVMLESVEEVVVDAHTLTVSATNGSVEITGKTLVSGQCEVAEGAEVTATATANDGYRFVNWTVTGAGSSVSDATDNPTTFTMGTEDATITANFEAIPTHTVTWSINGTETSEDIMEGEDITFPANPVDLAGKNFVGWTKTSIVGETDVKPSLVTSEVMGTEDVAFYAVYATVIGTPATLTKMASDETLSDGDKIVIVANDGTTEYGLYQKESKSKYIDKYVFDGQVETVAADDKNWVTANAEEGGLWSFGDATNGYIYNSSSNEFKIVTDSKTSFTVAFNSDKNGFTIKNGSRWFAYRADLTEANRLFRGAGESTTPTDGSVAYFDIYKYVAGNASYSDYCTSVTVTATIPANKEWITFCSTANLNFTSDITGLEGAYTITAHESQAITLTATEMTGTVKAGTGLLLRAAAVDNTNDQVINIPVAATGDEQADNMLKGVTVDTEVQPTDGDYTNLGLSNGEFHPYSAAGTLAAGKAYLQIPTAQMPTGGNNARLYIVLDGEATGINAIENSELRIENLDAPMYNLAGQRVTKSYKGVVIVNGKKFINK